MSGCCCGRARRSAPGKAPAIIEAQMRLIPLVVLAAIALPAPAAAGELFGGIYAHDIDSPLSASGVEPGADIQLGWRGGRIAGTPLQPYIFGAVNTDGETNYAAVGLSAKFGKKVYVRPGVGLALHTGSAKNFQDPSNRKIEFGSRLLFEPELGLGVQLNDRLSIEASWVHMSHAQLF